MYGVVVNLWGWEQIGSKDESDNRIVVKPRGGEQVGIQGGSIAITPEIGTKQYLVNISLSESSLLSTEFTNSVDGSTFAKNWLPG